MAHSGMNIALSFSQDSLWSNTQFFNRPIQLPHVPEQLNELRCHTNVVNVNSIITNTKCIRFNKRKPYSEQKWAGIAKSVERLATGWAVGGSNPGGGQILRTRPDRHCGPPSLPYNGQQVSFSRVARLERGLNHTPSSAQLYLYSRSDPGRTFIFYLLLKRTHKGAKGETETKTLCRLLYVPKHVTLTHSFCPHGAFHAVVTINSQSFPNKR